MSIQPYFKKFFAVQACNNQTGNLYDRTHSSQAILYRMIQRLLGA